MEIQHKIDKNNKNVFDKNHKIVYTCGVFDIFHIGHLKLLKRAKKYGKLNIGVVADEAVKILKGEKRPIMTLKERIDFLNELEIADKVWIQDSFDPTENIKKIGNINIFIKGDDQHHINTEYIENSNIRIITLERTKNISTSGIEKKIR